LPTKSCMGGKQREEPRGLNNGKKCFPPQQWLTLGEFETRHPVTTGVFGVQIGAVEGAQCAGKKCEKPETSRVEEKRTSPSAG